MQQFLNDFICREDTNTTTLRQVSSTSQEQKAAKALLNLSPENIKV